MKIVVVSFYFTPDIGPGPMRAWSLVSALSRLCSSSDSIDVYTTMPNRALSVEFDEIDYKDSELGSNVRIHRLKIPNHQNKFVLLGMCFFIFCLKTLVLSRGQPADLVISTSSRLFTAGLGRLLADLKGARFYVDVRDIFLETIYDIFPRLVVFLAAPVLRLIEWYTFSRADKINLISPGFVPYFNERYRSSVTTVITNGVDPSFTRQVRSAVKHRRSNQVSAVFRILYTGNIGDGQRLHLIIPEAAITLGKSFEFIIIGDGSRKNEFLEALKRSRVKNVLVMNSVKKMELLKYYSRVDALFLHLANVPAFRKVLPSKLFEYCASGLPVIAGVDGVASNFLTENYSKSYIFAPNDVRGLVGICQNLAIEKNDLSTEGDFENKFDRNRIASCMMNDALKMIK